MFPNPKKWIVAGLIMLPAQAMASVTTASFDTIEVGGNTYSNGEPGSNFNEFSVDVGGFTINVSGWSDTAGSSGTAPNMDPVIERAVDFDRNANGWSIENADELPNQNCGYSHSADNFSCSYTDYDFYLLDFGSESVELTGLYSSWSANPSDTQVSFAALDPSLNKDLTGTTFDSLLANTVSGTSTGSSSFTSTKINNSGYNNYYADVNVGSNVSSSLWIVSAYNTLFGTVNGATANNDGFKLAGVSFSQPSGGGGGGTSIPEPTTIAMFGLALLGLTSSRRKKL